MYDRHRVSTRSTRAELGPRAASQLLFAQGAILGVLLDVLGEHLPAESLDAALRERGSRLIMRRGKSEDALARPVLIVRGAAHLLDEAHSLGFIGRGALSTPARALLSTGEEAAVAAMTQALAAELADDRILVNAIVPSIIDTPANRADMPDADFGAWVAPADLAAVMLFLASEEARAVTGALMPVTGRV